MVTEVADNINSQGEKEVVSYSALSSTVFVEGREPACLSRFDAPTGHLTWNFIQPGHRSGHNLASYRRLFWGEKRAWYIVFAHARVLCNHSFSCDFSDL